MRGTRYLETDISNAFAANLRFRRHQDRLKEIAGQSRHPAKSQNFSPRKYSSDVGRRAGSNFFNAVKMPEIGGNALTDQGDGISGMDRRLNIDDL